MRTKADAMGSDEFVEACAAEIRDYLRAPTEPEAESRLDTLRLLSEANIHAVILGRVGNEVPRNHAAWKERADTIQTIKNIAITHLLNRLRVLRSAVREAASDPLKVITLEPMRSFDRYVFGVAVNAYNMNIREEFPERASLKRSLYFLLKKDPFGLRSFYSDGKTPQEQDLLEHHRPRIYYAWLASRWMDWTKDPKPLIEGVLDEDIIVQYPRSQLKAMLLPLMHTANAPLKVEAIVQACARIWDIEGHSLTTRADTFELREQATTPGVDIAVIDKITQQEQRRQLISLMHHLSRSERAVCLLRMNSWEVPSVPETVPIAEIAALLDSTLEETLKLRQRIPLDYEEIAEWLGTSVGAVRVFYSRAVKRLKALALENFGQR